MSLFTNSSFQASHLLSLTFGTILIQLSFSANAVSLLDDDFSSNMLNSCFWVDESEAGSIVRQGPSLELTVNSESPGTPALINGQNGIDGDFVISVRLAPGEGWTSSLSDGFFSTGLSVGTDPNNRIYLSVQKFAPNQVSVQALQNTSLETAMQLNRIQVDDFGDGLLRVSRAGNQWALDFDNGSGWQALAEFEGDTGMVYPSLSAGAINTENIYTVAFDEFRLGGGELYASKKPTQLENFLPRSDLMIGGVFENHVVWRKWGGLWTELNPIQVLADNGMNWARVGITNFSAEDLQGKPEDQWPNVWREDGLYWAAQEVRFQMLKDAKSAGMHLVAFLYLSGRYGEWVGFFNQQYAPVQWQSLDLDDLLLAIEQHTAHLTQRMIDEGIDIEIYEIGNETDSGLVGFQDGDRVNLPPGTDISSDIPITKEYIWQPQAAILKAAIKGIRSVRPDAKIALHPAGLPDRPAQYFTKAFFKYMADQGVEYDYAAITWPYPIKSGPQGNEWRLNRWSVPCWFYSMEELSSYMAALGKPMYIAEGAYLADINEIQSPPLQGFPYTEQGQAGFLSTMLNYVSNNLNMLGFFYFYPEFYPQALDPDDPLKDIGLFRNGSEPRDAVTSLNVNLETVSSISTDHDGHWIDPDADGHQWILKITQVADAESTGTAELSWCTEPIEDTEATTCTGMVGNGTIHGNRLSFPKFFRVETPVSNHSIESSKTEGNNWLRAEIAFRDNSSGILTFNGSSEWGSGWFSIQRQSSFNINAGLNDAWFYPPTAGQGFFITVFPEIEYVLLSWFTYDAVRPPEDVTANLGDPGHRWLNALGPYSGNQAVMDISITSGGIFDTPTEVTEVNDGTITLTFSDCENGTVEYSIPSINQQGTVPIQRVVGDNITLCEAFEANSAPQRSNTKQEKDDINTMTWDVPVTVTEAPPLVKMNAGLNDAWFYLPTAGQGFFITVFPDIEYVSLSWFTYDTELPPEDVTANLGDPGHRWLNALGPYSGNQAVMDISITSGGIFDTPTEVTEVNDGTITLTFSDCENGTVEYNIPSINQQGSVPIQRVVGDNIALCEALNVN